MKWIKNIITGLIFFVLIVACNKKGFLDVTTATQLVIPTSIEDMQAILDNDAVMNKTFLLTELSADDYFISADFYRQLPPTQQRAHIWAKDIFAAGEQNEDWNGSYTQVYYCNTVLEGLQRITPAKDRQQEWNAVKGSALFMRAFAFFNLAQLFAPSFDPSTAAKDLGIVLPLTAGTDEPSVRSTVQQTFEQIITDLQLAFALLPATPHPGYRNRPSQPAAAALLARVYLYMNNYQKAGNYADSCLQRYNALLDYSSLDPQRIYPFTRTNAEILFYSRLETTSLLARAGMEYIIDSTLYRSYATGDLRKKLFFSEIPAPFNLPFYYNSYSELLFLFTGLGTDEVYLIKAECLARQQDVTEAINSLNTLLEKRFTNTDFVPVTAATATEAIQKIIAERRKELIFRSIRWGDVKRLNKTGAGITLKRILGTSTYELPANDNRFTLPIPTDIITRTGMPQNPR